MSTLLQLTNDVLIRLRESEVTTISQTPYSKLIGKLINDSKRQVEDAFAWDALGVTITITTASGTSNYVVTGSGYRHQDISVNDTTNRARLNNVPIKWIENQQQLAQVQNGQPTYYAWNGFDGTDSKVEIWPTPDGIYSLKFNMTVPQVDLSADADVLTLRAAHEAIVAGAFARALVERGEDGGLNSAEAYSLFKGILADLIAIEANRYSENDCWEAC